MLQNEGSTREGEPVSVQTRNSEALRNGGEETEQFDNIGSEVQLPEEQVLQNVESVDTRTAEAEETEPAGLALQFDHMGSEVQLPDTESE